MLVLTVVDSATALKSGQEPQTVVVQRFCVPASVRRTVVALQPQAPESEAPPAVSISPAAQNLTPRSFAAGPRAEQSHDSGLCSPYSDPGDAVSERGKRTISPQQAAAVGSEVGVEMGGTISIDSLHNRLLERLFGGAPIGVATAHSISATTTAVSGSHSTSSQTSSNTAARPSGVMMPVSQQGAGQMNGSSSASNGLIPHTQSGTGVRVDENSPYHQKFRCLVANTAHRPGAGEGTSGGSSGGIYDLPTRITGASTLSIQDKKDSSASRSAEYSKRVRSPNANAALPQNRSDKRMRHDQGTSLGGPLKSFYSTAPSASTTESSDRTLFNRPSRSTGPRKPAIPSFACTASVRSASAPKTRPVLQDRSNSAAHHYTNIHAAPAVAAKRPKERVSVTINANTTSKKNLATSTTSRRNPVRVLDSAPAQNSKAPSPSQARPKTGEKLKTLSPKSSSRASSRTRRFCQTGGGGEGGGDLLQVCVCVFVIVLIMV